MAMPRCALLVIDMVSDYRFPDADQLVGTVTEAIPAIRRARDAADALGLDVVYANDIHDHWQCSREQVVALALAGERSELVRPLVPRDGDPFFHKGQHSAFYGTPLAHFLHETRTNELVLTGQVTEQCVLYTALDAHVRDYDVTVLTDGVAALDADLGRAALRMMTHNMGATLLSSDEWCARQRAGGIVEPA